MTQASQWPIAVSVALAAWAAAAAPGQDTPTFSAEVGLVQVEVRVTDDGRPVLGLGPEDFVLKENGQEQRIVAFDFVGGAPAPAVPAERAADAAAPPREARPERTWLYVIPEVQRPPELKRVVDALRSFLDDELPEGFMVSLGGLPFTDDPELLRAALDRMVARPVDSTDPVLDLEDDLIFEREMAAALQRQNGIRTSFVGMSYDPPRSGRGDDVSSLVSVERLDRQILFFGRLALLRYLDLIERMATLPGKKVILLYRSGLRLDADHSKLLAEIAAAAARHRVSFYATDARGLLASVPEDDRSPRQPFGSGRRRGPPDLIGRQLAEVEPQQGLVSLASATGGRSVVNSGDMGAILERVVADSRDYYLLGYRPLDTAQEGRFRKVSVSVKRGGLDVRAPKGWFEPRPWGDQSDDERSVALYRALAAGAAADVKVQGHVSFFAAAEGRTATLVSTGVRPDAFARDEDAGVIEATILVRVRDEVFDRAPIFFEQSLRSALADPGALVAGDPAAPLVAFNARVDLPPGRYSLRVLYRDDRSGRMGVLDGSFRVPDLGGESVPSSLLVTRLASDATADAEAADDLLTSGGLRYAPEPGRVFHQGDVVHWTYHLYHPTPEDRAAAEGGLQMGLLRDGVWLSPAVVEAGGEAHLGEDVIRFGAWIDTRTLEPGRYTVLAILPDHERREVSELQARFDLVPAAPPREDGGRP